MNPELLALDPLLKNNVKLFISHLLELQRTENVSIEMYNFYDHRIKFVEICGLIVGVESKSSQVFYTVDDSTGTIPCCYWIESNLNYKALPLGTLVRVLGKIATYRGQKQIIIDDIYPLKNPNEELAHFIEKVTLLEEYKKPYQLPTEQDMQHDIIASKSEVNVETYAAGNTIQALSNLIYDHISAVHGKTEPFTFTQLRKNLEVIKLTKRILAQQNENPEPYRIADLFDEAVNKLITDGLISAEGTRNGLYVMVDKVQIENFVMETMSNICQTTETNQTADGRVGVNKAYIIAKLKEKFSLDKKAAGMVAQITITDLFEKGFIYPTSDKKYKVTFE